MPGLQVRALDLDQSSQLVNPRGEYLTDTKHSFSQSQRKKSLLLTLLTSSSLTDLCCGLHLSAYSISGYVDPHLQTRAPLSRWHQPSITPPKPTHDGLRATPGPFIWPSTSAAHARCILQPAARADDNLSTYTASAYAPTASKSSFTDLTFSGPLILTAILIPEQSSRPQLLTDIWCCSK